MWKWLEFVLLLAVLCVVLGDDIGVQDSSQESRGLTEVDREGWRALNTFQDDDSVWIPRDLPQDPPEGQPPKRRRLRKRKRRPTPSSIIDELNSGEVLPERASPGSERRRTLAEMELDVEPWKEVVEEGARKPNVRRRVPPGFEQPEEVPENSDFGVLDSGRIQIEEEFVQKKEEQIIQSDERAEVDTKDSTTQKPLISDLKAVLKQSGTGSLSEILQQKNLSLSELLMGNQRAISALTESPQEVTEPDSKTSIVTDTTKYKRLPPSIGLRKNINRNFEQEEDSYEELSNKKILEAQRKRLSLLGHKDNRLFSTVTKYDVITEPTTERRIFVPSHPKYYTTTKVFKPIFDTYNEPTTKVLSIKEESTVTTSTTPKISTTSYVKPKLNSLPPTNAKISKLAKLEFKVGKEDEIIEEEEEEQENYPVPFNFPKPIPIAIQEVSGFQIQLENKPSLDTDGKDEPERMSIDLNMFAEKTTERENYPEIPESTTVAEFGGEKIVPATAKDEIMEIMKDPISRERLSRILESRNMTVKELVEQRERGSSQLHLADIFHNKTREPEPRGEPFVGTINTDYFNSFPLFGRQHKGRKFDGEAPHTNPPVVSSSSVRPVVATTEKTTAKPTFMVTSFPAIKIGIENTKDQTNPFLWNKLESDLLPPAPQSDNKDTNPNVNGRIKEFDDDIQENYSEEDLQRLDDVDTTLSLFSNEKLNVENNSIQQDPEVLINIPSGVKSAIFVSLAIICLSILVFLTILLVFKWTQRKNKRINYCNSLSTKIKSPIILQRRPTSAIKSFMNETLGRKNYYRSNVQSTDELWEYERERMPSF